MRPSSALCRTQEARQLAIAAGAGLANVKTIATAAAAAWAKEADQADLREGRKSPDDDERRLHGEGESDRLLDLIANENPDRGLADA